VTVVTHARGIVETAHSPCSDCKVFHFSHFRALHKIFVEREKVLSFPQAATFSFWRGSTGLIYLIKAGKMLHSYCYCLAQNEEMLGNLAFCFLLNWGA
jgi:hypothetical protein